jgi:hypothetical protein
MERMRNAYNILNILGDLGVVGRIILQEALEESVSSFL